MIFGLDSHDFGFAFGSVDETATILSRYRELGFKSILRRVNCWPKP
jgi:hypothetical protein